jgi:hypothetical protein
MRGNVRQGLTLLLRTCSAWHLQGVGSGRSCRCEIRILTENSHRFGDVCV